MAKLRFRELPSGVWNLVILRGVRSFAQGFFAVAFPLYLLRLGVSPITVGLFFTINGLASAAMTLVVGLLADRWGRRPFVLAFAVLTAATGLVCLVTRNFWLIGAMVVVAGFGRGGMGVGGAQGGPFAPALQALLAEKAGNERRTTIFSWASGVGSYCAAGGAFLSGLADWLASPHHPFLGYQALFALTLCSGMAMLMLTLPIQENRRNDLRSETRQSPSHPKRAVLSASGWRMVGKLSVAGAFNGLGIGFIVGFIPIWFHLRFGVGPAAVGTMTAVAGLMVGPGFLFADRLGRRWGSVRTVTFFRGLSPVAFALVPFMPTFTQAASCFVLALLLTSVVIPIRQSFSMGVVSEQERAAAVGIRATAARLPSSVSPSLTGYLISSGDLGMPFWAMAFCMSVGAVVYYLFFRKMEISSQPGRIAG